MLSGASVRNTVKVLIAFTKVSPLLLAKFCPDVENAAQVFAVGTANRVFFLLSAPLLLLLLLLQAVTPTLLLLLLLFVLLPLLQLHPSPPPQPPPPPPTFLPSAAAAAAVAAAAAASGCLASHAKLAPWHTRRLRATMSASPGHQGLHSWV